jgi:hypothetical protein
MPPFQRSVPGFRKIVMAILAMINGWLLVTADPIANMIPKIRRITTFRPIATYLIYVYSIHIYGEIFFFYFSLHVIMRLLLTRGEKIKCPPHV